MNVEQFLTEYPEFNINNLKDAQNILNTFETRKILESEHFKKLKRFIFQYAEPKSLDMQRVLTLYENIANPKSQGYNNSNTAQVFFSNLMKFIRYYNHDYERSMTYILKVCPQIIIFNYNRRNHYETFLDRDFFNFFDSVDELINRRSVNFTQKIPFTLFSFSGTLKGIKIPIKTFVSLYEEIQDFSVTQIDSIIYSMKIILNSRIKIDSTDTELKILTKIIYFLVDTEVARMLVRSNIRNLNDQNDIQKLLPQIMTIWRENNCFYDDKDVDIYWNKTINDGYKDLNNFYLFLRIYSKKGKPYIDNMLKENNNKPLINFQLVNKAGYNTYNAKLYPDRKMILVVKPYSDYNSAFDDENFNFNIPGNKYILNNITIQSYRQLAITIKELSQKQKIDIIIIAGHGNPEETHLGFDYNGLLNEANIKNSIFDNIDSCFNKDATCILCSCSTGKKSLFSKPIGAIIAKRLGIKVIAPNKDTGCKIIVSETQIDVAYTEAKKMSFKP